MDTTITPFRMAESICREAPRDPFSMYERLRTREAARTPATVHYWTAVGLALSELLAQECT